MIDDGSGVVTITYGTKHTRREGAGQHACSWVRGVIITTRHCLSWLWRKRYAVCPN